MFISAYIHIFTIYIYKYALTDVITFTIHIYDMGWPFWENNIWAISKTLGSRKGHPQIWEGPITYHTFVQ